MNDTIGDRIRRAREAWGKSQRDVGAETGLSQARLSRIESGTTEPRLNEVVSLSWALGCTVTELTGHSPVRDRAQFAARADAGADLTGLRDELTHFLEIDALLDELGVARSA
ncbi:MAG: helix-turn-helix transcriptional regulator [Candidatus Nanopelagicales bacterium]